MLVLEKRKGGELGMANVMILDEDKVHGERLATELRGACHQVFLYGNVPSAVRELRAPAVSWDIVILNVSNRSRPWCSILHELHEASGAVASLSAPFFLCLSTRTMDLQFAVQIEHSGARFVYEE